MSDEHAQHSAPYGIVFAALCVFTGLSWIADEMKQGGIGIFADEGIIIALVLAIASAKALCVMGYFMHLKFERNWKYLLLAPTAILAIGLPLALMPDMGVHYYTVDVPQVMPAAQQEAHADEMESVEEAEEAHH